MTLDSTSTTSRLPSDSSRTSTSCASGVLSARKRSIIRQLDTAPSSPPMTISGAP
jgi:hypothetical protein